MSERIEQNVDAKERESDRDPVTGVDLYNEHRGHPYVNESVGPCVPGVRVEIQPWTDDWAMGDRYGKVVGWFSRGVIVRMDKSDRLLRVEREGLRVIA